MGSDIHAVVQKRVGHDWEDIPSRWEQGRDYYLFAWLANVRNGFGFAGIKTHEPIKPISPPRGLPTDFGVVDGDRHPTKYGKYLDDDGTCWLGDHSHSWLLGSEILAARLPVTRSTGVITLEEYKNWNKVSTPDSWSGGISGRDIVVSTPETINNHTTHVQIEWIEDGTRLAYFIDEIKRLINDHGTIRIVFGFDS